MCVPNEKAPKTGLTLEEPIVGTVVVVPLGTTRSRFMCAFQRYFSGANGEANWVCTNCKRRVTWNSIKDYALVVYPKSQEIETVPVTRQAKNLKFRVWNYGTHTHVVKSNYYTLCGRYAHGKNSKPAKLAPPRSFLSDLDRQEKGEQLTIWKHPLCQRCEKKAKSKGLINAVKPKEAGE